MKEAFDRMNTHIRPDPGLNSRVLDQIAAPAKTRRNFRPLAAVAAMLALIILATPVMAYCIPAVSELMFQVSPQMAARFTPVQVTDTANGIRMEVVSASIHGATAEVCISFEDVKADRIDYRLRTEGDELLGRNPFLHGSWGGGIGNFAYDEESGKAIMVIEENYSFYSPVKGRYLTVRELFGNKITVQVDKLYWYLEDGGIESIPGPWRVTFKITESDYVGEHDDGVPATTSVVTE